MNTPPKLYTYKEISEALGVQMGTLYVWADRGKLPKPDLRVGQSPAWLPATIEPWIKENKP